MKRRDLLTLVGGATLLAASPLRHVRAEPTTVLKASDVHPEGYPTVQAVENMGKKLEAATGGRIGIQMYASMQLGGEKEAIEQAQIGALQFARVSVGALGPVVADLNVFNLPFLFRNTEHMEKVIDGPIGQALLDKVTDNPQIKLIGLCWMDAGARNVYDSKKPIRTIEDLKGQKVRVMGNPMFVDMMNALGGNGVAMGYDQVFSALQTGVVDGAENNPPSFVFDNHYQVAKYYSLTDRTVDDLLHVLGVAEEERQVEDVEVGNDRPQRPDADPGELQGADLRLLDRLLLAAELHRGIHLDADAAAGRRFELLAHVLDRLDGRVALGVHVRGLQHRRWLRPSVAQRCRGEERGASRQRQQIPSLHAVPSPGRRSG